MGKGYKCPNPKCGGATCHFVKQVGTVCYYRCPYCGTEVTENYPNNDNDSERKVK